MVNGNIYSNLYVLDLYVRSMLCIGGTLDPKKVKGKILACLRGKNGRVDKGQQASLAGAAGMILCNDKASGNELIADIHMLPASHIDYKDGVAVFAYINSTVYLSLSLQSDRRLIIVFFLIWFYVLTVIHWDL